MKIENFVATWALVGSFQGMQVVEKSAGLTREMCESIRKSTMIEVQNAAKGYLKEGDSVVQFVSNPLQDRKWISLAVIRNIGIGIDGRSGTLCAHYAVINTDEFKKNGGISFAELLDRLDPDKSYCRTYPSLKEDRELIETTGNPVEGFRVDAHEPNGSILSSIIYAALNQGNAENRALLASDIRSVVSLLALVPVAVTLNINLISLLPPGREGLQRFYCIFTDQKGSSLPRTNAHYNYSSEAEDMLASGRFDDFRGLKASYEKMMSEKGATSRDHPLSYHFMEVDSYFRLKKLLHDKDYAGVLSGMKMVLRAGTTDYLDRFTGMFTEIIDSTFLPRGSHSQYMEEIRSFPDDVFGRNSDEWKSFLSSILERYSDRPQERSSLIRLFGFFSRKELTDMVNNGEYDHVIKILESYVADKEFHDDIVEILRLCLIRYFSTAAERPEEITNFILKTENLALRIMMIPLLVEKYDETLKSTLAKSRENSPYSHLLVYSTDKLTGMLYHRIPERLEPLSADRNIPQNEIVSFLLVPFRMLFERSRFMELLKEKVSFDPQRMASLSSQEGPIFLNISLFLMSAEACCSRVEIQKEPDARTGKEAAPGNDDPRQRIPAPVGRPAQDVGRHMYDVKDLDRQNEEKENRKVTGLRNSLLQDLETIPKIRKRKERKRMKQKSAENFRELVDTLSTVTPGYAVMNDVLGSLSDQASIKLFHSLYRDRDIQRILDKMTERMSKEIFNGTMEDQDMQDMLAVLTLDRSILDTEHSKERIAKIADSFATGNRKDRFITSLGRISAGNYARIITDIVRIAEESVFRGMTVRTNRISRRLERRSPPPHDPNSPGNDPDSDIRRKYLSDEFAKFMKLHLAVNSSIGLRLASLNAEKNPWDDVRRGAAQMILDYIDGIIGGHSPGSVRGVNPDGR